MSTGVPQLSVVVPCFDEERRIGRTLVLLVDGLTAMRMESFEIVVVDDSSTDGTAEIVRAAAAADERVLLVPAAGGKGKGAAVRTGLLAAEGDAVLVVDADLAGDLATVPAMLDALEVADAVLGSRLLDGAVVEPRRTVRRRVAAWVFRTLIRVSTPLRVSDPQCGHKLFRRTAVAPVAAQLRTDGYAYEIELLLRMQAAGATLLDVPITWREGHDSKVRVGRDGLTMVRDAWRAAAMVRRQH